MAVHPVADAFPHNTTVSADTIRQELGAAFPLVLLDPDDIEDIDFSQSNAVAVPNMVIAKISGIGAIFVYDSSDNSSSHDGVSVLVSQDGKRYKATMAPSYFINVVSRTNTPPGSPSAGDRYIVGAAPSGAWASNADDLTVYDGQDWVFVSPVIGQTVYVRDVTGQMHWGEAGAWVEGAGSFSVEESSIGARELAFPWGMTVQSETTIPPGTRVSSGVTPTMPLGGTASNINDNSTATESTTSSLGNLSAVSADGRVIAKLDLGADTPLAAIEVVGIKASTGSSSANAMKLAYATAAAPTTWVELGAGFTLSSSDQTAAASGTFTARYVAVITEAKDWSTATHTLDDINAYAQATSVSDGVKYLVAANGIGVFSGQDAKVAEAWDGEFRFYTPYDGAIVLDVSEKAPKRYDDDTGTWISSGGAWVGAARSFTAANTGNLSVTGNSGYSYSDTTAPTTSVRHTKDPVTLSYSAKRAGSTLRLIYDADATSYSDLGVTGAIVSANVPGVIAVLRDSETDAVAWQSDGNKYVTALSGFVEPNHLRGVFEFLAIDNDPHTYTVAFFPAWRNNAGSDVPSAVLQVGRRLFTIEEAA